MNYNQFQENNPGFREAHVFPTGTDVQVCGMECEQGNPRKGTTYLKKNISTKKLKETFSLYTIV